MSENQRKDQGGGAAPSKPRSSASAPLDAFELPACFLSSEDAENFEREIAWVESRVDFLRRQRGFFQWGDLLAKDLAGLSAVRAESMSSMDDAGYDLELTLDDGTVIFDRAFSYGPMKFSPGSSPREEADVRSIARCARQGLGRCFGYEFFEELSKRGEACSMEEASWRKVHFSDEEIAAWEAHEIKASTPGAARRSSSARRM